jgi:hypothetical protein
LLELNFRPVRVFAPALPRLVAAQLFRRHLHAALDQGVAHGVKVVHFEAEMMNPLAADFRRRIGLEDFDELAGADLQIKSEQHAVLEKIEMRLQSQRAAIKFPAPVQIFSEDADMGEGFDHIDFDLNYKKPRAESNTWNENFLE